MGIRYEIDTARRVLICEVAGSVGVPELLEGLEGMAEDARLGTGFRQLFDLTRAEIDLRGSSGTDFVQTVSAAARKHRHLVASKLALVAPQPHQFGLLRMYEMTNEDIDAEIQVFWTRAEAEAWLHQPDDPDLDS